MKSGMVAPSTRLSFVLVFQRQGGDLLPVLLDPAGDLTKPLRQADAGAQAELRPRDRGVDDVGLVLPGPLFDRLDAVVVALLQALTQRPNDVADRDALVRRQMIEAPHASPLEDGQLAAGD